ncbi:1,4-alpha-glucan branching protein domain-containing protein [Desulfothermobacter acidiphilus]|uniref:1,4-alpha-glucan branching protein domain-containing protein n=1 Tax=Desulfothermobacter acidiphilus TaxID=1938353 RepID=UPI003F88DAF8
MARGYLALVLHAHLPFVRHPEKERQLEENWFYQALNECYLPLLDGLQRLAEEGKRFRLTLSLSPTLLSMLADPLLLGRFERYLERLLALAERELERTAATPFYPLASFYRERFQRHYQLFTEEWGRDLIRAFKRLAVAGKLELITTCATHGYLPLIKEREARRAQIAVGIDCFAHYFDYRPAGFWLPECGYVPGVDKLLAEEEIRYFFLETHGILSASPSPRAGVYAPLLTPAGVAALGRDPDSSRQVWDRHMGYPGDYWYREYYRDIGYELPWDYLQPYLPSDAVRTDTGFKYYRITGREDKEIYQPERAREKAAEHARHFWYQRLEQAAYLCRCLGQPPIIVAPYDAELFGHWWFEGPWWLEELMRLGDAGDGNLELATPSDYLAAYPPTQRAQFSLSSWGEGGYSRVWLNPANDWIYPHTHRMENRMTALCDLYSEAQGLRKRVLDQAARELLLAQSSDWAFILYVGSTVEYARRRVEEHIANFWKLVEELLQDRVDEDWLRWCAAKDNLFPQLDYRVYSRFWQRGQISRPRLRVLFLSWEYPPRVVGGLGRHVYDLTRALARWWQQEITVLTVGLPGSPSHEESGGIKIHRVGVGEERDFLAWVENMNQAMIRQMESLNNAGESFDLIHGHDWMIGEAACWGRDCFGVPLVVTIHATEHGRHRGIHTPLQALISGKEGELARAANLVVTCSEYMAQEVCGLFGLPRDKIKVIANGVDPETLGVKGWRGPAPPSPEPLIVFLGRLVPEKGVQDLIRALALIRKEVPGARLVICGRGYYEGELRELVRREGLEEAITFAGFVDGQAREALLREAAVAVFPSHYEPFGIVALEAMAAQVPVVVGDTGGLSELVEHGVDGFRFPPGDHLLLARYVIELLRHRSLAEEFCRHAWIKVRSRYCWRHLAGLTLEAYQELLAQKQMVGGEKIATPSGDRQR